MTRPEGPKSSVERRGGPRLALRPFALVLGSVWLACSTSSPIGADHRAALPVSAPSPDAGADAPVPSPPQTMLGRRSLVDAAATPLDFNVQPVPGSRSALLVAQHAGDPVAALRR